VDARPLPAPIREIVVPVDDDPIDIEADVLGYADGQSFMIEYIDSKGRASSRRITVYSIQGGRSGVPSLFARCHERQNTRQFRVDRITCCIDYSGEIHDDVPRFLMENFGMAISSARAKETETGVVRWQDIIASVRPDAILLSALSRADGKVKTVETNEIVDYLAKQAEREDVFLSDREITSIESYVKRLRPTDESIGRSLEQMMEIGADRVRGFLVAAVKVVEADEIRHPEEIALLNEMSMELIGTGLV
jgi:tellurite resistance protein